MYPVLEIAWPSFQDCSYKCKNGACGLATGREDRIWTDPCDCSIKKATVGSKQRSESRCECRWRAERLDTPRTNCNASSKVKIKASESRLSASAVAIPIHSTVKTYR